MPRNHKWVKWEPWELDYLIWARQESKPPVRYKDIAEKLGRAKLDVDAKSHYLGITEWSNSLNANGKYKDREEEITEYIVDCVQYMRMTATQVRDYLENVKGITLARSTVSKRIVGMDLRTRKMAKENAVRSRALRISMTRKRKFRNGEYDHLNNRGTPDGEDAGSESEGQDQGNTEEVQLLLRTAGNDRHGAERHA